MHIQQSSIFSALSIQICLQKIFGVACFTMQNKNTTYQFITTKKDIAIFIFYLSSTFIIAYSTYKHYCSRFDFAENASVVDYLSESFLAGVNVVLSFTNIIFSFKNRGKIFYVFEGLEKIGEILRQKDTKFSYKGVKIIFLLTLFFRVVMGTIFYVYDILKYSEFILVIVLFIYVDLTSVFIENQFASILFIIINIYHKAMYLCKVDINVLNIKTVMDVYFKLFNLSLTINKALYFLIMRIIMGLLTMVFVVFKIVIHVKEYNSENWQVFNDIAVDTFMNIIWMLCPVTGIFICLCGCECLRKQVIPNYIFFII